MRLSQLIQSLQELLNEHGDVEYIFTPSDDEGNSYNQITYEPEIRVCLTPESDETFAPLPPTDFKELKEWSNSWDIFEEDIPELYKVVMI